MANAYYQKGLQAFAEAKIDWLSDAIKAVLVDTAVYSPDLVNHQYLSDIPSGARVSISPAFTAKTTNVPSGGVLDAADITFAAVTGAQAEAVAIFKDTGTDSNSPLICFIDTAQGLPVTPGGSDITLVWDNGGNRICRL